MIDVPATLTLILSGLRAAIGAFMAQQPRPSAVVWLATRAYAPVVAPQIRIERILAAIPPETWTRLWTRLGRISTRIHTLYAHWRAGTLPKPPALRPPSVLRARKPRPATPRLPTRHAWVVAAIGYQAAGRSAQLNTLTADPAFTAFITAVPRAARLLRPLCRILGIAPLPPALALPPRTRPPQTRPSRIPAPQAAKLPRITLRRPRIPPDFLGLQKRRI